MNAGGLVTVQPIPQTSIRQETTPQQVKRMTCDGETLSAASLELRARFAGSIEKMKVVAERAKQRQDAARPALIKREREDQEKYHRRYMESAMKQYAEQQAKNREMNNTVMHPIISANTQTPLMPHAYSRFAPAPGASQTLLANTPTSTITRAHNRKRQFEQMQGWPQQASLCSPMGTLPPGAHMQRPFSMAHVRAQVTPPNEMISQQSQRNIVFSDSSISLPCQNMDVSVSSSPSASSMQGVSMDRSSSANDVKPMIGACSSDSLPPSTITSPEDIDDLRNEAVIPELADSQMKNLMDQFGPGNPLSDLGDGCLDGVLAGHAEHDEQPSTSTRSAASEVMQSPMSHSIASVNSNSIVSPNSLGSGTPNGTTGPASVPSATMHASGVPNPACNASAEPPTSVCNLTNGTASETFCGNPLGVPLGSSTPSTSSASCCFSRMPSTSVAFPPGCTSSGRQQSRVPYPGSCPDELLRHRHCDPRQQQHQMILQNEQPRMPLAQQRFMYPCMNGDDPQLNESNALLRMRQTVDDLSVTAEKRASFTPRFTPCGVDYTNIQLKQEMPNEQSFATNVSARFPYPQPSRQIHHVAVPNQQMFAAYPVHPQSSDIRSASTPDYSYPMRMTPTMNHQMAMYHMNGQIVSQQQSFGQQYYPSRTIYNYRYC